MRGTGEYVDTPVQAVYRAVGYSGCAVPGLPFDEVRGIIPNEEGRVIGDDGEPMTGVYATGWIKRGPVGLIGSTKSDAQQTIGHLVADAQAGLLHASSDAVGHDAMVAELDARGVRYTTWQGWELLDAYERELGDHHGELPDGTRRERVKVVERETMTAISRGEDHDGKLY